MSAFRARWPHFIYRFLSSSRGGHPSRCQLSHRPIIMQSALTLSESMDAQEVSTPSHWLVGLRRRFRSVSQRTVNAIWGTGQNVPVDYRWPIHTLRSRCLPVQAEQNTCSRATRKRSTASFGPAFRHLRRVMDGICRPVRPRSRLTSKVISWG